MKATVALVATILGTLLAASADARTVCRNFTVPVPSPGGVSNVPQTVCEEVPDPPPPQADPSEVPAQRLRNVREVCELAKAAYGEEVGQKLCQALIRAHSDCAEFTGADTYSECLQAWMSKDTPN